MVAKVRYLYDLTLPTFLKTSFFLQACTSSILDDDPYTSYILCLGLIYGFHALCMHKLRGQPIDRK